MRPFTKTFRLSLLLLLTACGGASSEAPAGRAQLSSTEAESRGGRPEAIVSAFFEALSDADVEASEEFLTSAARRQSRKNGGLSFHYDAQQVFNVVADAAKIRGERSSVQVTWETDLGEQTLLLRLRREAGAWRIHGAGVPVGDSQLVVDLEADRGAVDVVSGLDDESSDRSSDPEQRGIANQYEQRDVSDNAAREHGSYNALRAVTEQQHDAAWMVNLDVAGKTARSVLESLVEVSDLRVDEGFYGRRLDMPIHLQLYGVSRLEAIEAISEQLGLIPVYPNAEPVFGDQFPALAFREGMRDRPVAFSGPFMIELEELAEFAPRSTGEFLLTVRALGLSPAVLAANMSMVQLLGPIEVRSRQGTSLLKHEDEVYYTNPLMEHGLFADRTRYELVNLMESVEWIEAIEGTLMIRLPAAVYQGQIPVEAARQSKAFAVGPWQALWKQHGLQNQFEFRATDKDLDHTGVRFAPHSADGKALEVVSEVSFNGGDHVWADLDTPQPAESVLVKVFETDTLSYPFRIEHIPLLRYGEQPETILDLEFRGTGPLAVQFKDAVDRSDPEFMRVALRIENRSNKAVLSAQVTFGYFNRNRASLGNFPHTLAGELSQEGELSLVEPGDIVDREVVAFFMPRETKNVKIRVESVSFSDGTSWER